MAWQPHRACCPYKSDKRGAAVRSYPVGNSLDVKRLTQVNLLESCLASHNAARVRIIISCLNSHWNPNQSE